MGLMNFTGGELLLHSNLNDESRKNSLMELKKPFFSIIVPTYNRPKQLVICLQSLTRLDYPRNQLEVIVIDDGSDTSLQPVVDCFSNHLDVTLLNQTHAGPAAARNTGAERAKGEFLAFTDDDCTPTPDWLQKLAERYTEVPEHVIGGRILNALSKNTYATTSQTIVDVAYVHYNANPYQAYFFATNNLIVPAGPFHAIGGFDPTFRTAEDREFCDRWQHHGFKMTYVPEALVYHSNALNFRTFWRQHFNYGRGAYRFHRARAQRGTGRFRPDLKFYMRLFCLPFVRERGHRALLITGLLLISQVANTLGFIREWLHQIQKK
jgi:glycosyltransferase involved in cell wall biosynthesis